MLAALLSPYFLAETWIRDSVSSISSANLTLSPSLGRGESSAGVFGGLPHVPLSTKNSLLGGRVLLGAIPMHVSWEALEVRGAASCGTESSSGARPGTGCDLVSGIPPHPQGFFPSSRQQEI